MLFGNQDRGARTPTGERVAPMSYSKLEEIAEGLMPLLPTIAGSNGWTIDGRRVLEQTMQRAGFNYRVEEVSDLRDCAAFTVPELGLVVLRQDVYDGLDGGAVFSRSTVVHELSHNVLKHSVTLRRGPAGQHEFYEDSEWQAKALTAAITMPIAACRAAPCAHDLAHMCGTSVQAATYRIDRLVKAGLISPKQQAFGLFDDIPAGPQGRRP